VTGLKPIWIRWVAMKEVIQKDTVMKTEIVSQYRKPLAIMAMALLASQPGSSLAADSAGEPGRSSGKANPLKNVYFGEQHLHSQWSADAFAAGGRQKPEDAYRWAMGETITLENTDKAGKKIKKSTPYDFVALTDHAEYLGVFPAFISDPDSSVSKSKPAQMFIHPDPKNPLAGANLVIKSFKSGVAIKEFNSPETIVDMWKKHVAIANKYNKPGVFTALIAYEWTSIPDSQNLHRNVFFRGDTGPKAPYSAFDSVDPEDLWTYLEAQRDQGVETFAIPHNGNVSNGLMYAPNNYRGDPIDERYAKRRALNEPLTEIIQTKGSSDTHPLLSPNDEFADFEPFPNLISTDTPSKIKHGYIRQALTDGLIHQQKLGTNPFKYGIVAGADVHSGISANEEWNWHGAHGSQDNTPKKRLDPKPNSSGEEGYVVGSAGATGVWAEENTRGSIFDAMQRKETYGTSGPLIRLRFFGGWDYADNLVDKSNFVKEAYAKGVPMGRDLAAAPRNAKAPRFAVWVQKDPESGNLDRIQVIKGWVEQGLPQEKIYDVAMSDGRKVDSVTGYVKPVGNTVNIKKATYTNDIGDSQLSVVWQDPDFDPAYPAVYYVRVLEIPTPRWSTFDAKKLGVEPPKGVPATIQERAWSSPIWYTPAK
jgi:hypothetical protein